MGCWNGTCGITQMPIKAGEKVALIFLMENKYADHGGSGFCYSDNQYSPITIPIFGEYNDYGAIEEISRRNKTIVFNHLIELIDNKQLIITSTDDNAEKPKDYEELFDIIHDDGLQTEDGGIVGFMLIHVDVYTALVEDMKSRAVYGQYWTHGKKLAMGAEEYLKKAVENNKKMKELKSKFLKLKEQGVSLFGGASMFDICNMQDDYDNPFIAQFSGPRKSILKYYIRILRETRSKSLVETLIDFSLFCSAMEFGRKMWIPQCGAGSQCQDYGIHQTIAKCINEQIEKVKKNYKRDNNDYTPEKLDNCIREDFF